MNRTLLKKIKELERAKRVGFSPLTDEELEIKEKCESSLHFFMQTFWTPIEGSPFKDGWHLQCMAEHLEYLYTHDIKDLLINIPPRTGKSSLCSVMFPAWIWTKRPDQRFVCSSYSQVFSTRDSLKGRRLVELPLYRRLWGNMFALLPGERNKMKFENDKHGFRHASSVGGSQTGGGGSYSIIDDPNSMNDMYSEAARESVINWFTGVMPTRFTLIAERRRLVVQQRCHVNDLSGYILSLNDPEWVHLRLPMRFERSNRCKTVPIKSTNKKPWQDPRTRDGALLWPEGMPDKEVTRLETVDFNNASYLIAGQMQQRPAPDGGGRLKATWFKHWKQRELPEFDYVLQSWDTAMIGDEKASFSCGTTWGVFKDDHGIPNVMLLSMFHGQLDYPDLRKMIVRMGKNYEDTIFSDPWPTNIKKAPDCVLIEEKATGHLLLRDLFNTGIPIAKFNPTKYGDKMGRCLVISHFIENGRIHLRTKGPKYEYLTDYSEFLVECSVLFPNPSPRSTSSDTVDTMSQALIYLRDSGWLYAREDAPPRSEEHKRFQTKPYY